MRRMDSEWCRGKKRGHGWPHSEPAVPLCESESEQFIQIVLDITNLCLQFYIVGSRHVKHMYGVQNRVLPSHRHNGFVFVATTIPKSAVSWWIVILDDSEVFLWKHVAPDIVSGIKEGDSLWARLEKEFGVVEFDAPHAIRVNAHTLLSIYVLQCEVTQAHSQARGELSECSCCVPDL